MAQERLVSQDRGGQLDQVAADLGLSGQACDRDRQTPWRGSPSTSPPEKAPEHRFDEHSQEFPRHDERLTGRRHRYGYAIGFESGGLSDLVLLDAGTLEDVATVHLPGTGAGRVPRQLDAELSVPAHRRRATGKIAV